MKNSKIIEFKRIADSLLLIIKRIDDINIICNEISEKIKIFDDYFSGISVLVEFKCEVFDEKNLKEFIKFLNITFSSDISFISNNKEIKFPDIINNNIIYYNKINELEHEHLLTKWIFRNIRSGQDIIYNGNIVIIGDVNSGAYIRSSGNICITGSLRGTVHAGYKNNHNSVIIAGRLIPKQIRIGKYVGRAPDEMSISSYIAEIAYISDNRIVIDEYKDIL